MRKVTKLNLGINMSLLAALAVAILFLAHVGATNPPRPADGDESPTVHPVLVGPADPAKVVAAPAAVAE